MDQVSGTADFKHTWNAIGLFGRRLYADLLETMDQQCGFPARDGAYARAEAMLSARASALADIPFRCSPDPEGWIAWVSNVDNVADTYSGAWERLEHYATDSGVCYTARLNSLKRTRSLEKKIDAYRTGSELDLWDAVRFRVVFNTLPDLLRFGHLLSAGFGENTIRIRNYYLRPRAASDHYRAVHLVLALPHLGDFGFFELQLITAPRDAVGLVDHDFVRHNRLNFRDESHRRWLDDMRIAAAILDADGL